MLRQEMPVENIRRPLSRPRAVNMYGIAVGALIAVSLVLHLLLIALGWPMTNSDEGTMGMMALHIAYQGAHPIFFYGQNYMGSWEAFLAAGFFHIFGPSLFSLRIGTVLMFAGFLACIYLLSRLLFSRMWALVTLLLVGTGSAFMMTQEVRAIGGYAETLFFCTVLFLCATWLALTYQLKLARRAQIRRYVVYAIWGLAAGLGLWTDLLIVPPLLASGLLILLICWRELLKVVPLLCVLLALCVGAFPMIYYNLHAAPGQDSLSVFRALHGDNSQIYTLSAIHVELSSTFTISLPLITGVPFCPVTEIAFLGPTSPHSLACTVARSSWSASYLLLFAIACFLAGSSIWLLWRKRKDLDTQPTLQNDLRLQLARLILLLGTALSLFVYTFSSGPITGPGLHSRYLICLLTATPAIYWPLWQGIQTAKRSPDFAQRAIQVICLFALCCFCGLSLLGSVLAFREVPNASALNQSDAALIQTLEHLGVKDIYTDYWTCDKIAFESDEHIICAVLNGNMQAVKNRYTPYLTQVQANPDAAYVFPTVNDPYNVFLPAQADAFLNNPSLPLSTLPAPFNTRYTRVVADNYVIYFVPPVHK